MYTFNLDYNHYYFLINMKCFDIWIGGILPRIHISGTRDDALTVLIVDNVVILSWEAISYFITIVFQSVFNFFVFLSLAMNRFSYILYLPVNVQVLVFLFYVVL